MAPPKIKMPGRGRPRGGAVVTIESAPSRWFLIYELLEYVKTRNDMHELGRAPTRDEALWKDLQQVELRDQVDLSPKQSEEILAVHEALNELEKLDAKQADLVEMSYFLGNSVDEIAEIKNISPRTVDRDLKTARLFLKKALRSRQIGAIDILHSG
jgi:RNA polymerase sigma factor (sigma-70 family)